MKTDLVKGFRDYLGEEALKREQIKKILVETFKKYGFAPAETPVLEYEDFVIGENKEDEAVSDVYKLKDKGERELALRYEFTFQLKRLGENQKLPFKRYQIGEVFRDEPISANRFRQFTQCDADIISSTIKDEAEIFSMAREVLNRLNIDFVINFNNRKLINEILEEQGIKEKEKVIKEIDKLDKLSEKEVLENLKKYKAEKLLEIFKNKETFFEKYKSYEEIKELKKYCKYYNVDLEFSPSLARGLSYYNGTIFEIKTKKIKETITAGGSYQFEENQSTGISFGLERLTTLAKIDLEKNNSVLVISLNQDKEAINLAEELRKKGNSVSIYYGKPSKALSYANAYEIDEAIFVGEKEVQDKKFKIKNMKTGKEKDLVF